jgi:Tfp pilus assembly protein PilF
VHDSLAKIVKDHAVDFAARHYDREASRASSDSATLAEMARSLRLLGIACHGRGEEARSIGLCLLALDYARKNREVDPQSLDGWKNAGIIEFLRESLDNSEPIPRFRLPFDPPFDLPIVRGTYLLRKSLEIDPKEPTIQFYLALAFEKRGMDEQVLALWEKYVKQPNKNLIVQEQKVRAAGQITLLRGKLGPPPRTTWANRAELEPLVTRLLNEGRAATAAEVMETAYRPESRPWDWADRLAVLELHLGEPSKARAAWLAATTDVPAATRLARVAVTYLVESDFENARKSFKEAIAIDPRSFEAHYGLAVLEQDAGFADAALIEARMAEKLAPNDNSRATARTISASAAPYAKSDAIKP